MGVITVETRNGRGGAFIGSKSLRFTLYADRSMTPSIDGDVRWSDGNEKVSKNVGEFIAGESSIYYDFSASSTYGSSINNSSKNLVLSNKNISPGERGGR